MAAPGGGTGGRPPSPPAISAILTSCPLLSWEARPRVAWRSAPRHRYARPPDVDHPCLLHLRAKPRVVRRVDGRSHGQCAVVDACIDAGFHPAFAGHGDLLSVQRKLDRTSYARHWRYPPRACRTVRPFRLANRGLEHLAMFVPSPCRPTLRAAPVAAITIPLNTASSPRDEVPSQRRSASSRGTHRGPPPPD